MKWVTRERPKVDRVACPWLIKRFIDPNPEFIFLPADDVVKYATETGATPYDVEGVELTHVGPRCSFDAFLAKYGMTDSALLEIASIIRPARSCSTSGGAARHLPRTIALLQERSGADTARIRDLRRPLRVGEGGKGRNAHLESAARRLTAARLPE
jgi:hypothetical protein